MGGACIWYGGVAYYIAMQCHGGSLLRACACAQPAGHRPYDSVAQEPLHSEDARRSVRSKKNLSFTTPKRRFFGTARRWPSGQRPDNNILPPERYKQIAAQLPIEKIMRVPQSPHSLRKVVSTSSDSENDSSSENSSEIKPRPPRVPNFSKKSELRSTTTTASSKTAAASATKSAGDSTANVNTTTTNHRSSRDRTRISAVQRLVERKMAQKEKDREKERDLMFKHRSSSASSVSSSRMVQAATGNGSGAEHPNVDKLSLRRSLSRDRLSSDSSANKTYITITSGGSSTRIRESSPSKKDQILNKYCSPLKSTEIFKDLVNDKHSESNNKQDDDQEQDQSERLVKNIEKNPENDKNDQGSSAPQELIKDQQQKKKTPHEFSERKISFTTEKTILINQQLQQPKNVNPAAEVLTPEQAKIRKVSIDINYVYEQHYLSNPGAEIIQDEQMVNNLHQTTTASGGSTGSTTSSPNNKETSKRRASLEQRIKERSHSASSSMSTSSCGSSSESASSACSSSSSLSGGSGSSASSSSSSKDSDCCSSLSTPEPIPRQSKQRKISSTTTSASNISSNTTTTNTTTTGFSRNINIILEDEISNENCETSKKTMPPVGSGLKLPKPKTSFHRRFSQDHSTMNVNIKRSSSPPVRKISLQNNSTINTDR